MDYFEFFGLPISLKPDLIQLRKQYISNSKQYHPDFFTLADNKDQQEALQKSTLNNNAYNTLKDSDLLIKYVLTHFELLQEGQESVPQDFLMEMMDINEEIMDAKLNEDDSFTTSVKIKISGLIERLNQNIQPVIDNWAGMDKEQLTLVKSYYLKNKYLKRLKTSVENI